MGPMREHRWVAVLYALVAVRVMERVAERSQLVARRGRAKVAIFLMSRFLADQRLEGRRRARRTPSGAEQKSSKCEGFRISKLRYMQGGAQA